MRASLVFLPGFDVSIKPGAEQTVKKVTSWAAIIAVPTAITSFFGQNLAFPWRHTNTEFYLTAALTVGLALVLYVVFRRKTWL
ncbi:hypothetical protein JNW88_28710 [Micromonospora sp. ATA32]|nr:hypothetical protein [Micromonospora sp. ATA32]